MNQPASSSLTDVESNVRLMEQAESPNWYLPTFVVNIRNRLSSRHRVSIATALLAAQAISYFILLVGPVAGDGTTPESVRCNAVISWEANATCGINAQDCNPLESPWTSYRCPSSCLHSGSYLTPIGSGPYRGDSGICLAAIHSGVLSANAGGCFYLRRAGWHDYFNRSSRNGITSATFPAPYPLTYELLEDPAASFCHDISFSVIMPLLFLTFAVLVLTEIPETYLWIILVCSSALYSAGPILELRSAYDIAAKLQKSCIAFGGFVWLLWEHGGTRHFHGVSDRPIQLLTFYVVPFFVVLHMDYARVIDREFDFMLSSSFFNAEPMAILLHIAVVLIVVLFIIYLIYVLFKSNALKPVAWQYAKFLSPISILAILIGIATAGSFHLHHYMVALLIWGLVAAIDQPSSWSMLIQGTLLALFINGVINWGMAPLFDIQSEDGDYGKWQPNVLLAPSMNPNTNSNSTNLYARWVADEQYNRTVIYSLQLNMIEVYRGPDTNVTLANVPTGIKYTHEICAGQVRYGDILPCIGRVQFQFANASSLRLVH